MSVRDGFRCAMAVASLAAMTALFAGAGMAGRQQSSTAPTDQTKKPASKSKTGTSGKAASSSKAAGSSTTAGSSKTAKSKSAAASTHATHPASRRPTAQTIRLTSAFKASEQLRPMAQQLASTRSAAAYSGVEGYAHAHPGEGAAAAYLALGHAYMLDHRFADAAGSFRRANASGAALDDYADYLGAQASVQG